MSGTSSPVVLVVAKAPVAGEVKTRLGASVGMDEAADLAAAALLDTLRACEAAYGADRCHLALAGELSRARRGEELTAAVAGWTLHVQRGDGLAQRLTRAHHDAATASGGAPVVQVGMDTPHASAESLRAAGDLLLTSEDAVVGPAHDGGWWLLGVGSTALLAHLDDVPMSTATTGADTVGALERAGARVQLVGALTDVDEEADAREAAAALPDGEFAAAWAALSREEIAS